MVRLNVENVYVVHPVDAIVTTKVVNFTVYKAARSAHAGAWFHPCDQWLDPGQGGSIEVEYIVQLAVLIRLATKQKNLFFKRDRRMLETSSRRNPMGVDGTAPSEI